MGQSLPYISSKRSCILIKRLCYFSFFTLSVSFLTSCNDKKNNDLSAPSNFEGQYIDEFGIDLLTLKIHTSDSFSLSNHSSSLPVKRDQNVFKGLVNSTGQIDTIYFRFISKDSVIHELWGNKTLYTRADSVTLNKLRGKSNIH